VLSYLMHHQDRVVPRTELVEHIYDQDFDRDSNTIEVFVGRLRRKIGSNRILTERGLGISPDRPQGQRQIVGIAWPKQGGGRDFEGTLHARLHRPAHA
jgi:two-component system OmpR family response regulator